MACSYQYYNEDETYFPRLYCNIDNKYCIYSKKCMIEEKFVSLENQGECYKYIMEMQKNIPKGSYYVETYRFDKNNKIIIYAIVEDSVIKIKTDLTELNQNYIYIKESAKGYQVSLTPFVNKTKQNKNEK